MHLIWENLIPNLVKLWTGTFKGLSQGTGSYQFSPTVWQAIGKATAQTGATLPTIFGPHLGNISQDHSSCTTDAWSVWTQYIAPVLLESKFTHQRYYNHFVDLVELLQLCLQYEMPREDVARIRSGFIDWVQKYERCAIFDVSSGGAYVNYYPSPTGSTINMILPASQPALSLSMHSCTLRIASMLRALSGSHGPSPWNGFVVLFSQPSRAVSFPGQALTGISLILHI